MPKPSLIKRKSSQRLTKKISIESLRDETSIIDQLSSLKIANGSMNQQDNEYIEVPFVKVKLDLSLPQDYFKKDLVSVIKTLRIPKWYQKNSLNWEKVNIIKISGAMTNAVAKIEYRGLPSLLLRIYGRNNDSIIDRDYELEIIARLSAQNIGPSLYGSFENGRFEQFLENATTLTRNDIRNWKTSQRIARRMKELHSGVPLLQIELNDQSTCWKKIFKWINIIESNPSWIKDDSLIQEVLNCQNWSTFKQTVNKYYDWLKANDTCKKPLVFSHNDTQYGNLLFNSPVISTDQIDSSSYINTPTPLSATTSSSASSLFPTESNILLDKIINPTRQEQSQDKKLVVIDFEYSGANPAAYDLANHFCEWMYDYNSKAPWHCSVDNFPNKEQQLNFIYSYVSHLNNYSTDPMEITEDVKIYYNEIIKWRATVQVFWSCWAIIQNGGLRKESRLSGENGEMELEGINGEKYIIKQDDGSNIDIDMEVVSDSESVSSIEEENGSDDEPTEGVSIDTFDYIKYCNDKISLFWGDLIKFDVINVGEAVANIGKVRYLDCTLL